MLSSSHCPYCGNPLVTQNIKADVIQCFHGPNKFPSMPPSPEISRAFKKASFGPENGCPDWEVSNREEVGISSCSSSEQQQCFVFPGAACVQEPMSSVPHSQDQSCPKHHLSPLPSGWGLPGSLAQQNSKGIHPGWGGAYALGEDSGADSSVLPLTCLIFSDHPICMPPLFQDESLLLLSPLLDLVFLFPLRSTDNDVCFPSFSLSFSQPELTRRIHLFLFQKLPVTNTSAKGLIQAARDWWGARCFDHSLSPSAMSLYELMLKLFKVLTVPLCELI